MSFSAEDYLMHHGIRGQKWGVRRYQNPDGTLTEAGKKRYAKDLEEYEDRFNKGHWTKAQHLKVFAPVKRDIEKNENYKVLRQYLDEARTLQPLANKYGNAMASKKYGSFATAMQNGKMGEYLAVGKAGFDEYMKKHSKVLLTKTPQEWERDNADRVRKLTQEIKEQSKQRLGEFGNKTSVRETAITYDKTTGNSHRSTYNEVMDAYIEIVLESMLKNR